MKHLIPFFVAIPLLVSCAVVEEGYYGPEYDGSESRVEMNPHYHTHGNDHGHTEYRPAAVVTHGHGQSAQGGHAIVVHPRSSNVTAQGQRHAHRQDDRSSQGVTHSQASRVQQNQHGHLEQYADVTNSSRLSDSKNRRSQIIVQPH